MHVENQETWKAVLMGEALLFGLLGKALYENPDKTWLESLIAEDIFSESPLDADQAEIQTGLETMQRWTSDNRGGLSEASFSAIKQDQLRLFIGIDKVLAPAWESVYFNESRLVFQEQTLQVREWYARYNLQIERLNQEPDDHIGLEMGFVAHLATLALQALDRGDSQDFEDLLQAQRDFLSQHLLRWGPSWAKLTGTHAQTDFYRGLANLTHGALLAVAEHLQIELPKEVTL